MKAYLARFNKMVENLKAQASVQVLNYHSFSAASDEQIRQVETSLGYSLHSSIKEFYRQSNGLQLRWIFKNNEHFSSKVHKEENEVLAWDYVSKDYWPEEGSVMILPIEMAFLGNWEEKIYFDWMKDSAEEVFQDQRYPLLEFSKQLRPFDLFNKTYDMAFLLNGSSNPPVIMGSDHQACYTDSLVTDFASYLELVLAGKGLIERRNQYYFKEAGHQESILKTPESFWTPEKQLDLDIYLLKDIFPESANMGADTSNINTQRIQNSARHSEPILEEELLTIVEQHHSFLESGGAGGQWKILEVAGLVLGIYVGVTAQEGVQAGFERKHLPEKLDLQGIQLPFSNFCGVYAEKQDFSNADLSHSLLTDTLMKDCDFSNANLSDIDFSRSDLSGACFKNAKLKGADFENCNLQGADFRGANLEGSRFPGANLNGVRY